MPNSLGTLYGALIIQRALQLCFTKRPLLRTVSMGFRDLDGRAANALLGQPVTSRIHAVSTVTDFSADASAFNAQDVTGVLSQHKKIHHKFTPAEYNATDRQLIEETAEPMAVALANHVFDSIAAFWTFANFPKRYVQASGWDYDTVRAIKKIADGSPTVTAIPDMNRFAVFNGDVYSELLADPQIISYLNNPAGSMAISTGKLPDVLGFGLGNAPSLSGNSENLIGAAGTPDSMMWLARAPKNPEEMAPNLKYPGNIGYVEDPVTGFRVLVTQFIDQDTLDVNNRISWLQGFTPGNTANLVRLVSDDLGSDDGS